MTIWMTKRDSVPINGCMLRNESDSKLEGLTLRRPYDSLTRIFFIEYAVYMTANPTFNPTLEPDYTVHVKCVDETSSVVTDDLTVDINPDQPPVITSLPTDYSIHEHTINQEKIHDIVATDPEGKDVTCILDGTAPPSGPFDVWDDTGGMCFCEVLLCSNEFINVN